MRRTLGITATAAAISMAAILPAGAATSPGIDDYSAAARASAVDLTVFGEQFALADTTAGIDARPFASANGLAVLTPLPGFTSDGAPASTDTVATGEDCGELPVDLPAEIPTDLVCVKTLAKLVDGKPLASSAASEIVIEIKAPPLDVELGEDTSLGEIVDTVQDNLGDVFDSLMANAPAELEQTQIDELQQTLQDIINGLLDGIQEGDVLVRITVAPAKSVAELTDANVSAQSVSNGAIVELLPDLPDGALAVATIGTAKSSVDRSVLNGRATPTGHAALIDVTWNDGLLDGLDAVKTALGQLDATIAGLDETLSGLLPCDPAAPLAGLICVSVGSERTLTAAQAAAIHPMFDLGPTTVGHQASVLELRVLTASLPNEVPSDVRAAAPSGGVVLQLGETVAAAAATTPLPSECVENCDTPPPLPRTGGDAAMPLTLGLLALGMGGAALVRRSRTI